MSTALTVAPGIPSAFYEVSDVLCQQSRSARATNYRSQMIGDRSKMLAANFAPSPNRSRNFSDSSVFTAAKLSPTNGNMISYHDARGKPERNLSESSGDRNSNQQQQQQKVNSSRYKTELCRPFEESGHCKYGDKCQFAHGHHELRNLARHPKYKTELCRTFHTIGFCPYGPRCHFIHSEDERKLGQINMMKAHQVQQQICSTSPTPIQRPKALNFNLNYGYQQRDNLGSTADSPHSSVTDSPTMSPTFVAEDFLSNSLNSLTFSPPPPHSAPNAFQFPTSQDLPLKPALTTPLSVETMDSNIASLAAGIQQAATMREQFPLSGLRELRNLANNQQTLAKDLDMYFTPVPASPLDSSSCSSSTGSESAVSSISSSCTSPMELVRGLRLPIFSRLSQD